MNTKNHHLAGFLSVCVLVTLACGISTAPIPDADNNWPATAAAQTWSAMQAIAALSATPTFTLSPVTDTPIPTNTPVTTHTPTPTRTTIPILTPIPTNTPTNTPTMTRVPTATRYVGSGGGGSGSGGGGGSGGDSNIPCYAVELIRHITIPNGQVLLPGTSFTKIWRVRNSGRCAWERGAEMVIVSSNFAHENPVEIDERVRPGDTVDVSVNLEVPMSSGLFQGRFLLRVARRTDIGPDDNNPFRVNVISSGSSGVIYNFISNACDAVWRNGNGRSLNCPNRRNNENGFVRTLNHGNLEDGNTFSPVLWTHPQMQRGGQINGQFPALLISPGDRLEFRIGCLEGYNRCDVRVELFYRALSGNRVQLLSQHEVYDGHTTTFSESLDYLAGNYISIIVNVTSLDRPAESALGWADFDLVR